MKPEPIIQAPRPWILPALLLWGVQSENLLLAFALGLILECPRWIAFRWDIPQSDFNRLWNFNAILFIGVGLYLFFAQQGPDHIGSLLGGRNATGSLEGIREISATAVAFVRWFPAVFFPFVLAHAWSPVSVLPWITFSLYQQKQSKKQPGTPPPEWAARTIHPIHLYQILVLLASTAAVRWPWVYLTGLTAVIALAVWPKSPGRFKPWSRLLALASALAITLAVQQALAPIRNVLQSVEDRWLQGGGTLRFDQTRATTAIGNVGRLKQHGGIVLRIRSNRNQPPGLLREAAFSRYKAQAWTTTHREFTDIRTTPDTHSDLDHWRIHTNARPSTVLSIARFNSEGGVPLAIPEEIVTLSGLPLVNIERNAVGSVRLKAGPDLISYTVESGPEGGLNGIPEMEELELQGLPPNDLDAIQRVAAQLELTPRVPAQEAVQRVEQFFANGFTYSLWQAAPSNPESFSSPLAEFLLRSRSGHCEFYATTTTLLLRAAGIPTRYVVGFSCNERLDNQTWVARGRDAHAWTLAFVDGRWISIDTTPGTWRGIESQTASRFQGLLDLASNARFQFTRWRQESDAWRIGLVAFGILGLGWLSWRQLRGSRWKRANPRSKQAPAPLKRGGLDSEFFEVLREIESAHGQRPQHETPAKWLARIFAGSPETRRLLLTTLQLHEQYRFDPNGVSASERTHLAALSQRCRAQLFRAESSRSNAKPRAARRLETDRTE